MANENQLKRLQKRDYPQREGGYMGSSWSGFLPQNEIIKLQWAVLEGCQTEMATKALSALLENSKSEAMRAKGQAEDEGAWSQEDFDPSEADEE